MFDGLVLCIERKKLQSGKPTGELLGDNILFEKCKEFTIRETFTGILGDNILFKKMSDYEITQGTGSQQLVERYKKNEIVTGFENVWYIRERIHNIWVIR